MAASWLTPAGTDRTRMLEMDRRIRPVRRAAFGVLALALLACGPWLGFWTLIPLAMAAMLFKIADRHLDRAARPENGIFAAWAGSQVIIAVSVALTGGPDSANIAWFAIPLVTLGSRFSERGIVAGVIFTLALLVAVSFGVDPQAVIDDPPKLIAPIALIIASTMLITVLMRSDVATRAEAVIDPLTGLLNRKALNSRAAELEEQSQVTGLPVGIIISDLDHFKAINDTWGHAVGDAVLKEVAELLRTTLRAFDAIYRVGGEEFVILAAGAGASETEEMAERLRVAVAAAAVAGGLRLTMSFGTSVSKAGEGFTYATQFARADEALFRAKADGRDRVRTAGVPVAVA